MGSPRGKKQFSKQYNVIYKVIEDLGHVNLTDFLISVDTEKFYVNDISDFFKETNKELKKADVCIFDASIASIAIGHLISTAVQNNKPVIVFYIDEKPPHYLTGMDDSKVQLIKYEENTIAQCLLDAIDYASSQQDTRFNFFVSPKHINFLDWVSHNKKIPRSVFLRRLIEKEMANDSQYTSEQN